MYKIDQKWLEHVNSSKRSPYKKIHIEQQAKMLHDTMVEYFTFPIKLTIKKIGSYPWLKFSYNQKNKLHISSNTPFAGNCPDHAENFRITVSPKFLRAKEDDVLVLIDFIMYGDEKSTKTFKRTFAAPGFRKRRYRRGPARSFNPVGKVYHLEIIGKKIEKKYFYLHNIPRFMWGKRFWVRRLGCYCYDGTSEHIIINPALDDPSVPICVIEKIIFHELLHAYYKNSHAIGTNCVMGHDKVFREAERVYEKYGEANEWLVKNWRKLIRTKKMTTLNS